MLTVSLALPYSGDARVTQTQPLGAISQAERRSYEEFAHLVIHLNDDQIRLGGEREKLVGFLTWVLEALRNNEEDTSYSWGKPDGPAEF